MIKEHYAAAQRADAAGTRGDRETTRQILLYSVVLVAFTVAVGWWLGPVYTVAAVLLGAYFLLLAWQLRRDTSRRRAVVLSTTRSPTSRCSSSPPRRSAPRLIVARAAPSRRWLQRGIPRWREGATARECRHTGYAIRPPRPPRRVRCHAALRLRPRAELQVSRSPAGAEAVSAPGQRARRPRLPPHPVVLVGAGPRARLATSSSSPRRRTSRTARSSGPARRSRARPSRSRSDAALDDRRALRRLRPRARRHRHRHARPGAHGYGFNIRWSDVPQQATVVSRASHAGRRSRAPRATRSGSRASTGSSRPASTPVDQREFYAFHQGASLHGQRSPGASGAVRSSRASCRASSRPSTTGRGARRSPRRTRRWTTASSIRSPR